MQSMTSSCPLAAEQSRARSWPLSSALTSSVQADQTHQSIRVRKTHNLQRPSAFIATLPSIPSTIPASQQLMSNKDYALALHLIFLSPFFMEHFLPLSSTMKPYDKSRHHAATEPLFPLCFSKSLISGRASSLV